MTRTLYTLSNGVVVNTMAEAIASGLSYKVTYEKIEEAHAKFNPKRLEKLLEKLRAKSE